MVVVYTGINRVVNVQDFTFAEADGGRYTAKGGMKFDDSRQLFGVLDVTNGSVKNFAFNLC